MLSLSGEVGRAVMDSEGRPVGRLADMTVRLAGPRFVERLLVRPAHGADLLVPWSAVISFGAAGVRIRDISHPNSDALVDDELLLARDVLDTQVVDIAGQRLARVADVVIARTTGARLQVVGVEVGFGGVLRRLGLRRLAARVGNDAVAWTDLHLTSERGHAVQLATPRSAVHHLDARGLAAVVSRLHTDSAAEVLAARDPADAAEAVRVADPMVAARVLLAMPDVEAAEVVAAMPAEHALRWRARLAHRPVFLGRSFLRSRVWPRRRTPKSGGLT